MKKIKKLKIRFLIWLGWKLGIWRSISNSKKYLKSKSLASELAFLAEVCYYTHLDKDYLYMCVKNRIIASIFLNLEGLIKGSIYVKTPPELCSKISDLLNINIQETEIGYRVGGQTYSFWSINCPKEIKRLLCLLAICLDNNKSGL